MKSIPAFLLFFVLLPGIIISQPTIKGKVVNADDGTPVPGSSVFISNTSKGTTADKNGYFELNDIPAGKHELVVSSVGYETNVFSFSAEQLPLQLKIELGIKVKELQNVTVEPSVEEGWDKWGKLFTDNFIGQTPHALNCKIKNEKAIRFRYFRKSNRVIAYADEPVILENKALGYRISYQLEEFEVNFKTNTSMFSGYPLFEEMDKNRKKWVRNRDKAYYGSLMHFMYCLYHDSLEQQGFEVRRMKRIYNTEKERIKNVYSTLLGTGKNISGHLSQDSIDYYERILQQDDYKEIYDHQLLTADSLVVQTEGNYKTIFFTDYLYITYKKETEDAEYLLFHRENRSRTFQRSYIFLPNSTPVIIDMNGSYYPPQEIITMAYWGWSEKMADCLPIDYTPSKH
jgi:CarboxypepD_reg-like domain